MQVDTLLLALLCGHFLGDFILQTDGLAERKTKHGGWLLYHVFVVSTITWILLGNLSAWWIAGLLLLLHLSIDYVKLRFSKKKQTGFDSANKVSHDSIQSDIGSDETRQVVPDHDFMRFVGDQILHVLVIVALWFFVSKSGSGASFTNYWTTLLGLSYAKGLLLLTGLAVCVWGIGVVLKFQMAWFAADLADKVKQGLPKGGKTIGMLERLLVFMFVLAGKPEGVGFVIAAKSVFRIGELTNRNDKDHAEYIMIGTLRSFTYALVVAFITKWLIGHIR